MPSDRRGCCSGVSWPLFRLVSRYSDVDAFAGRIVGELSDDERRDIFGETKTRVRLGGSVVAA